MDEKFEVNNIPWPIEEIPSEDFVTRQALPMERTGKRPRKFPKESHFKLRPGEDGLSVNWVKYLDTKSNFILLGLTHNRNGDYLDYSGFKIFKYSVKFLRSLDGVADVEHKPIYNGNPAPVGKPNNRAHAIVIYPDDEEIRMNLSDYCRENFDHSFCEFDISSLDQEINNLRERLNDTPYHIFK